MVLLNNSQRCLPGAGTNERLACTWQPHLCRPPPQVLHESPFPFRPCASLQSFQRHAAVLIWVMEPPQNRPITQKASSSNLSSSCTAQTRQGRSSSRPHLSARHKIQKNVTTTQKAELSLFSYHSDHDHVVRHRLKGCSANHGAAPHDWATRRSSGKMLVGGHGILHWCGCTSAHTYVTHDACQGIFVRTREAVRGVETRRHNLQAQM